MYLVPLSNHQQKAPGLSRTGRKWGCQGYLKGAGEERVNFYCIYLNPIDLTKGTEEVSQSLGLWRGGRVLNKL